MEELKKKIIRYFLVATFTVSVLESALDSVYDDFLFQWFEEHSIQTKLLTISYLVLSISIFLAFAVGFTKVIGRKIQEETHRQINEKNLLYANIAHDLKTPITSILGFSRALQDDKVMKEQVPEIAHTIYIKSKQTDELINTLFHYTKLETDAYELNKIPCDICALVRNSVANAYETFEEKQIRLDVQIPDEEIVTMLDYKEFTRAMDNLVVNSYKHNERGSRVRITVSKEGSRTRIEIADNGARIDAKMQRRIFDPFICGDQSRDMGGNGLGLAIAKKIVEKHSGKLSIEDKADGYVKAFVVEMDEKRNMRKTPLKCDI